MTSDKGFLSLNQFQSGDCTLQGFLGGFLGYINGKYINIFSNSNMNN